MSTASLKDRIPPHNIEAEQATLGAILLDWDAVGSVITHLRAESFYSLQHQTIFKAILSLYNKGQRGDILTLTEELRQTGKLDAAGGVAYVASLPDHVPTSSNVEYYAQLVKDDFNRRELIKISSSAISEAHDDTKPSRTTLEDTQNKLFALAESNQSQRLLSMWELVPDTFSIIEKHLHNQETYTGVPSGFSGLDKMTSGFQNSEMIIIGARPSMGKTALALSMIHHIAIQKNIPTGIFSLEMSYTQIGQRLISQIARMSGSRIRSGMMTQAEFQRLQDAAGVLYDAPLCIADTPNMKMLDLRAMARKMKQQYQVKIIFIDYIGLITSDNYSSNTPRHEQVSEISRSLKSLARELDIPIVALCQVSRDSEGKEPTLANLRDSGSIEQDADVVMFIHRERKATDNNDEAIEAKILLAKQRNGPIGNVDLIFLPSYAKFENRAEDE
ncbi:MAG: replicative DNA helicase [Treponema sp.]|nr:replicative DNA helicase [Spirochaetia bacterium]MDD7275569.1 replicative DNA helicase [Treponema sp.]MDY3754950.1 replicative DNA helicase [Treponema sp.]MDY4674940.1 replicative DNA helicase [Treponema sp.]